MNKNKKTKAKTRANLRVFGGSSHPTLTKSIARKVGVRQGEVTLGKFANNEISVALQENVRGQEIYVIQTGGGQTPNDDLMELLFLINAFKLASVNCINVVVPFFWYSKGDKKDSYKRVPITAKLVTNLIRKAGANHVMIIDPHTPQMEGFFETPIDALKVEPLFCDWIKKHIKDWSNCVVVSPDEGGARRCTSLANDLNLDFAMINNRKLPTKKPFKLHRRKRNKSTATTESTAREQKSSERELEGASVSESDKDTAAEDSSGAVTKNMQRLTVAMNNHQNHKSQRKISISGSVSGRHVIIVDDMIDTGQTIKEAIETLRRFGAIGIHILATHALFSGNSAEIINSNLDIVKGVVVTNTVPQVRNVERLSEVLQVIDVSGLIAEYIRRHHYHESVSVLGHFLPIRDEKDVDDQTAAAKMAAKVDAGDDAGAENDVLEDESEDDDDDEDHDDEFHAGSEAAEDHAGQDGAEPATQARDLRLMHLRKGFRLSSMCWDDQ